jgi:hypothetical protein
MTQIFLQAVVLAVQVDLLLGLRAVQVEDLMVNMVMNKVMLDKLDLFLAVAVAAAVEQVEVQVMEEINKAALVAQAAQVEY